MLLHLQHLHSSPTPSHGVFQVGVEHEIPIMKGEWVVAVWQAVTKDHTQHILATDERFLSLTCPALYGMEVCVSQLDLATKAALKGLIEENGEHVDMLVYLFYMLFIWCGKYSVVIHLKLRDDPWLQVGRTMPCWKCQKPPSSSCLLLRVKNTHMPASGGSNASLQIGSTILCSVVTPSRWKVMK